MDDAHSKFYDARRAMENGDDLLAEHFLIESLEFDAHFKTYELLGDIAERRADVDNTFRYYASAYGLNPCSDCASVKYARSLFVSGRPDAAQVIVSSILKRNPSYGPARRLRLEFM